MKYDIITFGSAAMDVHVKSKAFKILKDEKDFGTGEGICLSLGSKVDVEDIVFLPGGGGTNVAATFAKQGFKTAFCGGIGVDLSGLAVVRNLKNLRVDTRFVVKKKDKRTNTSVVISNVGDLPAQAGDRTILVYRGASDVLTKKDIPFGKIKNVKWFYLAPLAGSMLDSFEEFVNFASENKIKIAMNPSKQQLEMLRGQLKDILHKVNILFLNQEEASILTGIPFQKEPEIFKKLDEMCSGITVMTKGGDGVTVSDGKYLYSAWPDVSRKIMDTTGAGDSFAGGFLSAYIRYNEDITKSIQLGLANSEANLSEIGAQAGLLNKKSEFKRVEVAKQLCTENNLCLPK